MPAQVIEKKPVINEDSTPPKIENSPTRTIVGWQGIRFTLPPEWNVTGFSMDRDNGYLRVDAPGNGTTAVQVRWSNAAKPNEGPPTAYSMLAPFVRQLFRKEPPPVPKPNLKASLEKLLKDTEKQARKAKSAFESVIKAEREEGAEGERTAMSFSWSGAGRGQGKIWYCEKCRRIVIAQVVGMGKDSNSISVIASQLFQSLQDHSDNGYELWALYDLQMEAPDDFKLEAQKLLAGYLSLTWGRKGEKITVDRWGLANITLKKFTLEDWFRNNAQVGLKGLKREEVTIGDGHDGIQFTGSLSLFARLRAIREARGSLLRFPTRYSGIVWHCAETNKIFALQVTHSKKSEYLFDELKQRSVCHTGELILEPVGN